MTPFTTKICGITDPQHAIDAFSAGADAIGLNFYSPSKRSVNSAIAAEIIAALKDETKAKNEPIPKLVGVFVNHSIDEVVQISSILGLDGVQLHGDETVCFFAELTQAIEAKFQDVESRPFYVRAVRTQPRKDSIEGSDQSTEAERVSEEIKSWAKCGVDLVLLDAAATGEFGGTGKTIDWSLVPDFQSQIDKPIVLAGGLNASNVAKAIQISGVSIVDVASGVESAPGQKDAEQVRKFVSSAKQAFAKQ